MTTYASIVEKLNQIDVIKGLSLIILSDTIQGIFNVVVEGFIN